MFANVCLSALSFAERLWGSPGRPISAAERRTSRLKIARNSVGVDTVDNLDKKGKVAKRVLKVRATWVRDGGQ
ncbi:hypothetical protein B0H65DRAFT_550730 [Neurospora tetraspora]|uniref:Uncharacterized protein n=1 Tax=Neurospora tetraspora TaxID=94610 RepID=A0AAE0JAT9_9PEZI|nr:hypothetical protein B0H65DRAFT_550730 [Neurospora tetraspora]